MTADAAYEAIENAIGNNEAMALCDAEGRPASLAREFDLDTHFGLDVATQLVTALHQK